MKTITKEELAKKIELHQKWLRGEEGGRLELIGYDLSDSNLSGSNLSGSNLDYGCLPLWCGSLNAHFDDRQIIQIVYHAVKAGLDSPNVSKDVKTELRKVAGLANHFHRVGECGRIEAGE